MAEAQRRGARRRVGWLKDCAGPPRLHGAGVVNHAMTLPKNPSPDVGKLAKELRSGHRAALARAITLIESRRGDHQAAARELVQALLPATAKAVRVGMIGSETAVCDMTDFFLALMLPGAGDELQGIKKGLVELADMIAINKADGDNIKRANLAAAEYRGALHILSPRSEHWHPPVLTYSALTGTGMDVLWQKILDHRTAMNASGEFAARRREQQVKWMWSMLEQRIMARLRADAAIRAKVKKTEAEVADGRITPAVAAEQIAEWLR